ncbi:MAG TPA: tetratricopeptide repeat protein [Verrucomicrobiota bacterium]|nr:tetratricopeptide repeat protein [Verrucomicrobiota bacterium]HQL77089.1 tetratricopeptide repeat protein [Verrucomicrobiota bacterium]
MEPTVQQLPVSHKLWAWFEANKKPAIVGTVVVLVAALIIAFVLYRRNATEVAASEALSKVPMSQVSAGGSSGITADAYLKVASTYPKSSAAARAVLQAGGILFAEGKYPEAKAQFERFRREYASSPFLGQALLGIASCLNAQGQTNEAMTAYKELIDRRPGDSTLSQARFALARLHEAQNEPEKARNLYEEVERTDAYGSLGDEARMRLEDLKRNYPALFAPAAPLPTNAAPIKVGTPK